MISKKETIVTNFIFNVIKYPSIETDLSQMNWTKSELTMLDKNQ